jgi:hypothetical protein
MTPRRHGAAFYQHSRWLDAIGWQVKLNQNFAILPLNFVTFVVGILLSQFNEKNI